MIYEEILTPFVSQEEDFEEDGGYEEDEGDSEDIE